MIARFSATQDATEASSVTCLAALLPDLWQADPDKSALLRLGNLAVRLARPAG
jgi:hypothetical protein